MDKLTDSLFNVVYLIAIVGSLLLLAGLVAMLLCLMGVL